jgi:hypothetical protein
MTSTYKGMIIFSGEMRVLMEEIYLMGEVEIITHHNHH